jgi:DNA-binding transcriptional MerR regulator
MQTEVVRILNGKEITFVTIAGLGKLSGKSPITLRKWEEKGWLPPVNIRGNSYTDSKGNVCEGERLYSKKYALLLAAEIKQVVRGVPVSAQVRSKLHLLMKQERAELINL